MSLAIQVNHVGKCYRLSEQRGYINLKEVLARQIDRLAGRGRTKIHREDLWAVKDVSFDINAGELIGLIGYNGSGKSTLLKLIAQVTKPTTGEISVYGRIGSLLEVGTGFHQELTGQENIYLSGSILGMSWKEVARKYDEIVAFSEMERFLHMPVKHYSSGMYLKLAFSVAAHLDPDILLVDEALAVGDIAFRTKSLNKMRQAVRNGTTVIFVSHSMAMINESCSRCLLMQQGQLIDDGLPAAITAKYTQRVSAQTHLIFAMDKASETAGIRVTELRLNKNKPAISHRGFHFEVGLETSRAFHDLVLSFGFCTMEGTRLLTVETSPKRAIEMDAGQGKSFTLELPRLDLTPGFYLFDILVRNQKGDVLDARLSCAQVEVLLPPELSSAGYEGQNCLLLQCEWESA